MEVSQLQIAVTSSGIKEATDGLNELVKAATAAESKSVILKTATDEVAKTQSSSATAADKLVKKYQETVDLMGASTEKIWTYKAAAKGADDSTLALVASLAKQKQSYDELAAAQAEAIRLNKEYDKDAARQAAANDKQAAKDKAEELKAAAIAFKSQMRDLKTSVADFDTQVSQSTAATEQTTRLKAMAEAAVARVKAQDDEARSERAAEQARVASLNTTKQLSDEQKKAGLAANDAAVARYNANMKARQGAEEEAKSVQKLKDNLQKLLGQIDPFEAKYARLDQQEKELKASRDAGILTVEKYREAMAKLTVKRDDLGEKQMEELAKNATSAGAAFDQFSLKSAAARRELMVMAREMARGDWGAFARSSTIFAERAGLMNAAIMALTNPLSLFAAGLLAVGTAAYVGSQEIAGFNKAMIMTNGYAGLSANQFTEMSKALGQVGHVGAHEAASALTEVAKTGKFTSENIGLITKSALQMKETTGASIESTIKIFEDLQKSPVDAALKLNETYHYLTVSTYEQIKALQDQGDAQGAADLAFKTFSDNIDKNTPKIIDQAGYVEKAWLAVKAAIVDSGNAIMNIGRPKTTSELIANLEESKRLSEGGKKKEGTLPSVFDYQFSKSDQERLDTLKAIKAEEDQQAAMKAADAKANEQAVTSAKDINSLLEKGNKALRERNELARNKRDWDRQDAKFLAENGVTKDANGNYSGGAYDETVEQIKRRNRVAPARTNEYGMDAQLKALTGQIEEEKRLLDRNNIANKNAYDVGIENLKEYLTNEYDLKADSLREQKALVEEQIEIAKGKKNLAAVEKYKNDLKKLTDEIYKNGEEYNAKVAKADSDEQSRIKNYQEGLDNLVKNRRAQIADMMLGANMSDQTEADMKRTLKIQEEYQTKLLELNKKYVDARRNDNEYQVELQKLKNNLDQRLKAEDDYNDARAKKEQDWESAADKALANYLDKSKDTYSQVGSITSNALTGMTDALTNFVMTGKLSFADLAKSIIAQIVKMQIAAQASNLFSMLGLAGGSTGAATSTVADSSNLAGAFAANGAVFENGASTRYFANGGAFTNGVVSNPTNFDIGTMGEAGPEAIVPLTKTSDGSLGVTMKGMGSDNSNPVTVHTEININNDGTASVNSTSVGTQQEQAKALAQTIENISKQTIYKEMQQGGSIWKMSNGKR